MLKAVNSEPVTPAVSWSFEYNPPMGGAAGEAFTNTLASSGMHPAAVLAREAIQNSVDARSKGEAKVGVRFLAKSLVRAEKAQFIAVSGLGTVKSRANALKISQPNCLKTLGEAAKPLNLLYIDDYNTTGLEGDPTDPDSKFYRFLLSLGDGSKEHSKEHTGGSYGFGKSVYSSNSAILSMFAYSRTVDGDGKPLSLLFGCGYFRKHKFEDAHYTGRAWFGVDTTPEGGLQIVEPLLNEDADRVAADLGFDAREVHEKGTSVLIVDAVVDTDEILKGVEDWWWPRLIRNELDVTVVDSKGKESFPRPKKREDLKPFIDAFYLADGQSPPNNKTDFRKSFLKVDDLALGVAGFKLLEKNRKDEYAVPEERLDSVALIRAPLMVVAYYRPWNAQNPPVVGTFFADEDIDDILRSAEPPAHDRWDPDARRLQDATGQSRAIVDRVLRAIKRNLRASQGAASPPPPPRPKKLTMLERTLANFLTPAKKGAQPPAVEPSSAPINLFYDEEPRAEAVGDKLRLTAAFSVKLKAEEDLGDMIARVRITCPVIEDGQAGDDLRLTISSSATVEPDPIKDGWSRFSLTQSSVKFVCESELYDPLWTVKFVPEIEPVGKD
ncbi:hypothetical protein ELH94_14840 [Rhizobium leguminosarum]|uniref:hypothetical protein n=1 Tax=Rhizobium leguminosarum TaxID=384 RepID=UPI0010307562|nr:hypothetical protein [Rhizobium leguminosarum]TAX97702.1 hypothetical protein ELH94_14840 [Rhizobium leguminosarum]